jgi:hypothetical protein
VSTKTLEKILNDVQYGVWSSRKDLYQAREDIETIRRAAKALWGPAEDPDYAVRQAARELFQSIAREVP